MSLLQLIALTCLFSLTWGQLEDSMADPSSPETKNNSTWNRSDYPDPRIVIVGPTGAGKSSLSNALLGCDPMGGTCSFPVCSNMNSCTKETTIGTGQWLGDGQNFTVVDTPGFGDSDGQDNLLIEEMINVLNDDLGYTNIILLLLDGTMPRFTSGLHNMLRQMSSLFGEAWWDNMVIGVSKWKYSKSAIDDRNKVCDYFGHSSEHCKNEEWFMREIRAQLQDKFHLDRNFTFAFIHSHSQTGPELADSVQQEHYQAQAEILWEAATTGDSTFDFKTIDDVLEENELLKKKNRKLNFLFETNIATLHSLVRETKEEVKDIVDTLQLTPIGTIIAWVFKPTKEDAAVLEIPDGWHRCDGSMIPQPSIWAGKLAPNLNHEKRFLRGGSDGDMLNMEDEGTKLPDHKHIDNHHTHISNPHYHDYRDDYIDYDRGNICSGKYWEFNRESQPKTTSYTTVTINKSPANMEGVNWNIGSFAKETRPKNMNVIYIIRVW